MYAAVANCHFNGLSIIQELGRNGVKVVAFDCVRSVGTFSRYAEFFKCPNPAINEDEFIQFLVDYGIKQNCQGIIFPTNDEWAMAISKNALRLEPYYKLVVASSNVVQLVIQKQKFHDWAILNNYRVPKTWDASDLPANISDFLPLIFKPEFRRVSGNEENSLAIQSYLDQNRLTVIYKSSEIAAFYAKHQSFIRYFVAQEYVSGLSDSMITVGVYVDQHSNIRGLFSGRKVRGYPPSHGDCVLGQSEFVPDFLVQEVSSICKKLRYSGIAEFEYKKDINSGEYYLIEINPRSWSWIGITPKCGVSLPLLAFRDLSGYEIPFLTRSIAKNGQVKYVKIFQDFQNCMWKNKAAGYPNWSYDFRAWLNTLRSKTLVIAEFQSDDIFVTIFIFSRLLLRSIRSLYNKITLHLISLL